MEQKDVFISYSRKDFVDENKNVIPGNAISAITDALDKNGITYWIDRDGIYSGQEFENVIIDAINASSVFLFVSSSNSNQSKYTMREIWNADSKDKFIIPFKIEDVDYHTNLQFKLAPLDFISYFENKEDALNKLVRSVNNFKAELAKKERKLLAEAQKEELKQKIKALESEFNINATRLEVSLKEIMNAYAQLGVKTKNCPVCDKEISSDASHCNRCGWQFYALPTYEIDKKVLSIVRSNWKIINTTTTAKEEINTLKNKNQGLLEDLSKEQEKSQSEQKRLEKIVADLQDQLQVKEQQIKKSKCEIKEALAQQNSCAAELADLKSRYAELEEKYNRQFNELSQKEDESKARIAELENLNSRLSAELEPFRIKQKKLLLKTLTSSTEVAVIASRTSSRSIFLYDNIKVINLPMLLEILKNEYDLIMTKSDFKNCITVSDLFNEITSKAEDALSELDESVL